MAVAYLAEAEKTLTAYAELSPAAPATPQPKDGPKE
jgi:hypothetical protein